MKKKQLLTATLTMILTLLLIGCSGFSNGERVGTIVKIAKEGGIFKTYEAELIRGGLNGGTGVIGKPFDFTIIDTTLLPVAYQALQENKEVKITYHSDYLAPLSSGNKENNFVDSIAIINEKNR